MLPARLGKGRGGCLHLHFCDSRTAGLCFGETMGRSMGREDEGEAKLHAY